MKGVYAENGHCQGKSALGLAEIGAVDEKFRYRELTRFPANKKHILAVSPDFSN
jgi:hypothetical protein